jgi:uncharacterized protein
MYNIKHIGNFETMPEPAVAIYETNIEKMQSLYDANWDINEKIHLGEYTDITPLELAVVTNNFTVFKWLLENKVSLDVGRFTIIEKAAQYSDGKIIDLLLKNNALDFLPLKKYSEILIRIHYGKNYENIALFEQYGVTVKQYGGAALRSSASDGNMEETKMWIEMGADVNYHQPDMVFPYSPTPLIEAVRHDHTELAEYLIKCGADITITDKYGDRPYSLAATNKNTNLMQLLKSLEPIEWHNEQEKLKRLKSYKMPADMLTYLKTSPGKIHFSGKDCYSKYMTFYHFIDLLEMKWKRKKLISLIEEVDGYELYIVWSPAEKAICYIDPEHQIFAKICSWKEFIKHPEKHINNIIDGVYDDM